MERPTPQEFRKLYAIPYDIENRQKRINRLEVMQAEGPQSVADVVKASHGEGSTCYLGHATVHGTDAIFFRREKEIQQLKKINAQKQEKYLYGVKLIEQCDDVELRAMLSAICIEGKKPQDVAIELMEFDIDIDGEAIRSRVRRWINRNLK